MNCRLIGKKLFAKPLHKFGESVAQVVEMGVTDLTPDKRPFLKALTSIV